MSFNCRYVVSGRQLVVTFTIEGRVLRREDAVLQTVEPPDAPLPVPVFTMQVKGKAIEPLRAALNASRARLSGCFRDDERMRVTLAAVWEPVGEKAIVGRLTQLSRRCTPDSSDWPSCSLLDDTRCIEDVLGVLKTPAPPTATQVTLWFSSGK